MNSHSLARRLIRIIAATALLALSPAGFAWVQFSATPVAAKELNQWHEAIRRTSTPSEGCFHADYPSTVWKRDTCVEVPLNAHPHPVPRVKSVANGSAQSVGNGNDYAIQGLGLITQTVGSFPSVTGVTSENGVNVPFGGGTSDGITGLNEYTLQINSQKTAPTKACNGHPGCTVWQQFDYAPDYTSKGSAEVFMQYWLLGYGNCPIGWEASGSNCYKNSNAVSAPDVPATQLANLKLSASATSGGNDSVVFTNGATAYTIAAPDSVLYLSTIWTQSEFNVFGNSGGSQAQFNNGSSILVNVAITDGSTATPTCIPNAGTTGETTNLNLGACTATRGPTPSIQFVETSTPLIAAIVPACGPADGEGKQVTLIGYQLGGVTKVTFDSTPITIISKTDSAITAGPIPPCSPLGCATGPGAVITAISPAGTAYSPAVFKQIPVVTTITPSQGGAGSTITVSGYGFYNGTPTPVFNFGPGLAQNVSCPASTRNTQCTMTAPPGSGAVVVTTGNSLTCDAWTEANPKTFTYFGAPTVTKVTPSGGSIWGGTKVVLQGTGFTQNMEAGFGDSFVDMQNDCPTSTECIVTTQASKHPTSPGWVNVVVANLDGTNMSTPGAQFNYEPYPKGYMQPSAGPPAGGTMVVVAGMNLGPSPIPIFNFNFNFNGNQTQTVNATCKVAPPGVNAEIQEICTFVSPPLTPAGNSSTLVNVTATVNGMTSSIGGFTYVTPTPPGETCSQCVASGGICSKSNGKFICKCQKSSPTGQCE